MPVAFSPTAQDVERYRRLRTIGMDLADRLLRMIPKHGMDEIAAAIGLLRQGMLVFNTDDEQAILGDACIFDWHEDGKNLVQLYAETHRPKPGTDEGFVLDAYLHAKYRVLMPQSAVPGAGLYCSDVLNGGEELFLMDINLSKTLPQINASLATRTLPLGKYCMTTGAGLPLPSDRAVLDRIVATAATTKPGRESLSIIRMCLAAKASEHVAYADALPAPRPGPKHKFKRRHRGH